MLFLLFASSPAFIHSSSCYHHVSHVGLCYDSTGFICNLIGNDLFRWNLAASGVGMRAFVTFPIGLSPYCDLFGVCDSACSASPLFFVPLVAAQTDPLFITRIDLPTLLLPTFAVCRVPLANHLFSGRLLTIYSYFTGSALPSICTPISVPFFCIGTPCCPPPHPMAISLVACTP